LEVRRAGQLKVGDEVIGTQLRVKVVKNKVGAPFKIAEFDLLFDSGISKSGEILDLAVKENLVTKSGAWYTIPSDGVPTSTSGSVTNVGNTSASRGGSAGSGVDEGVIKLGQGREKARLYLEEHKDLLDQLDAELRKRLIGVAVPSNDGTAADDDGVLVGGAAKAKREDYKETVKEEEVDYLTQMDDAGRRADKKDL